MGYLCIGNIENHQKFDFFEHFDEKKTEFSSVPWSLAQKPSQRLGWDFTFQVSLAVGGGRGALGGGASRYLFATVAMGMWAWGRISISMHTFVAWFHSSGWLAQLERYLFFLPTLAPHKVWKCVGNLFQCTCGVPYNTNYSSAVWHQWDVICNKKRCASPGWACIHLGKKPQKS